MDSNSDMSDFKGFSVRNIKEFNASILENGSGIELGTHIRAKRKREEMQNMLQKMRKAAQQQAAAQHK